MIDEKRVVISIILDLQDELYVIRKIPKLMLLDRATRTENYLDMPKRYLDNILVGLREIVSSERRDVKPDGLLH